MSKRTLIVSQYADPNLVGGNNNVNRQANALKQALGLDVEILTCPDGDGWTGPFPSADDSVRFSCFEWVSQDFNYHIVKLPKTLFERVPNDIDWQLAVEFGIKLLTKINPSIVHLQHWRGLWWILESANQLSIPTVYTPHDWGIGCLRTILVKGDGGMCDGLVDIDKCVKCIWKGRGLIGKMNELLVSTSMGENLFEILNHPSVEQVLTKHGAVRHGLRKRVNLNYQRAKDLLSSLSAIIVPNCFAKVFYRQFDIPENRIYVVPWYYDLTVSVVTKPLDRGKIVFGFIGRISPEKGLDKIFDALLKVDVPNPIHLVVAGAIQGEYAEKLRGKYRYNVGKHSVEWMGWMPHEEVHKFYERVDAVIISSECIENGPLTLIESFAFKRPVIISDSPTAREFVKDGETGYLVPINSVASLGDILRKISLDPNELVGMKDNLPIIKSSVSYASVVSCIYTAIES